MTPLEAVLLGIVQGVFMFVPVSSTAHLVLTQHAMIRGGSAMPPPDSPEMILFDLVVHVGTLVSILIVFRRPLTLFVHRVLGDVLGWAAGPQAVRRPARLFLRLFGLCLLAVLVTGVTGLAFKAVFEQVFAAPMLVAGTLTLTGALLWWTDRLSPRKLGLRQLGGSAKGVRIAVLFGLAQALSLIPGLSRSGLTIIAALALGLKRRWAAEFSFFVAIPTILAATLVQGRDVLKTNGALALDPAAYAIGFVVAAAVGTVALRLVLVLLYRAKLKVFSVYLWALALAVLVGGLDMFG